MSLANGIDISYANATTPGLDGREFVFVRATYGTTKDVRWDYHSANVRKAGRVLGAYAFGIHSDPVAQARAFLDIAGSADMLALDLERESGKPEMTEAQAAAFIATVQATGRSIGLYHSDSGFPDVGQDWNWVAKWGSVEPARPWKFWQYRGYPLDLNYFNGSEADLAAFVNRSVPVTITDPTPKLVNLPSGRQLYKVDGTTPLVKVIPATVDTYSPAGGPTASHRYVVITTGGVRQQAVVRTSGLVFRPYCPTVAPGDVTHTVAVQIDGTETYRTTV